MLIRGAELECGMCADVRIADGRIVEIGPALTGDDAPAVEAHGGLLLPGLHDHHIHIAALAAARSSVRCGPPDVVSRDDLAAALRRPGTGWLRGIGYHEGVAGLLDRGTLDEIVPDRPVRIQHRGGRMWFLNSAALELLLADRSSPPGLDRAAGRLFESDAWLQTALAGRPPCFAEVGALLAGFGVSGVTEISPANDAVIAQHFAAERAVGNLPQKVLLAGRPALQLGDMADGIRLGPVKLHLHEADLPGYDDTVALIRAAHDAGRAVAVHCVSEVELVFTLAAVGDAGACLGDRIEHASIAPDSAIAEIARLGLAVVGQPHFIAERGDAYRADLAPADLPLLYRQRAFLDAGVTLAGGSDAPFGRPDPWGSMGAAVARTTPTGMTIGVDEALTPEQALDLYLADPEYLDRRRRVAIGAAADLCLLDRNWGAARVDLASVVVRGTWVDGRQVHDRVDQPPA